MAQQRIEVLDVLRGYALMGLFLIHMVEYYEIYWVNPIPHGLNDALFAIFGGKAFAMFALLFGVSFFIIFNNQENRGVDFRLRFIWRLVLLLVMGYCHSLLYGGDILQVLALSGLCLVVLWRASCHIVVPLSLFFLLMGPSWLFLLYLQQSAAPAYQPLFTGYGFVLQAYADAPFWQLLQVNAVDGNIRKWLFMLESGRFSTVIGMGLLGFALARSQFFSDPAVYLPKVKKWLAVLVILAAGLLAGEASVKTALQVFAQADFIMGIYTTYINLALTFTSVCLVLLLFATPVKTILQPLAAPGRMTLSIYIGQSLLCVPIYYGFGLKGWQFLGQELSFILGVVFWVLQIIFALWWFKHYRYGPLEWLWRAITFVTWAVPFKLEKS